MSHAPWHSGSGTFTGAHEGYNKNVGYTGSQRPDTSQQDTSAAGITADLDKLLADNQQNILNEQLNQIVAQKGKGLATSGVDPLTPWGKRTGKFNHIRDKYLKYGMKGLTEGEKSIATHYLGITGGAGTVPTPYSGAMDRFMKTSPAHAKAYTDKFGGMGKLNYFMATAPENIAKNTLLGQIVGGGWETAKNIGSGIWNVAEKPVKELGTMTKDVGKFLTTFGKPHDAKIMEINEEAKLPLNEAIKEQNIKSGVAPDDSIESSLAREILFGLDDDTEDIIDTESISYDPGKNLQAQDQYPQLQGYGWDYEELMKKDALGRPDQYPQLSKELAMKKKFIADSYDWNLKNLDDESFDDIELLFQGAKDQEAKKRAQGTEWTGSGYKTPLQGTWQNQQNEINELKKSIMNNPVMDAGTGSNPYKDYSGVIGKNLPSGQSWTNVDPNEFLEGGKYNTESIFDSEAYENLSEDEKKALGTIDWGGSLLGNNFAHGGYANMSTYDKLKMIADGIADSE